MIGRTSFKTNIASKCGELERLPLSTVQINVGKLCNQACLHCHVEAGPKRKEIMTLEVGERIIKLIQNSASIKTVDITGGAPELNANFRAIASTSKALGLQVIDRCNLTVFFEPGQEDLPQFLKDNAIHVIASLPCYSKDNIEKQRGSGVFQKSIDALKLLNELGYGHLDTGLTLDLVYNPLGPTLPQPQEKLQAAYTKELGELFQIKFNNLFTITNLPIGRFLHQLRREERYEEYMDLLALSFNLHAAQKIMCRSLVSVGWTGELYDCDFNQMLEIPLGVKHRTIWEIDSFDQISSGKIAFSDHCYACTAGTGSSCGGSLVAMGSDTAPASVA
jgi:radical SAM/Cys-rich protein